MISRFCKNPDYFTNGKYDHTKNPKNIPGTPEHKAAQISGSFLLSGFRILEEEERHMVRMLKGEVDIDAEISKAVESCKINNEEIPDEQKGILTNE